MSSGRQAELVLGGGLYPPGAVFGLLSLCGCVLIAREKMEWVPAMKFSGLWIGYTVGEKLWICHSSRPKNLWSITLY